ncbi:MAG: hypothetical protein KKB30_06320 [Proteobacteria bacterium]|nr:hypothetical protein [Pseudomonadota bacterium]MBU1715134.1 hypothetical protein [Pseudomonadota bacterium]
MIYNLSLISVSIMLSIWLAGCAIQYKMCVSHPPTYKEINAGYPIPEDTVGWGYLNDLSRKLKYNKKDLGEIRETNKAKATYILGAALQSNDIVKKINLLDEIILSDLTMSELKVYYQQKLYLSISQLENKLPENSFQQHSLNIEYDKIRKMANDLVLLDKNNSFPRYLLASVEYLLNSNNQKIYQTVKEGNDTGIYNDYSQEKFRILTSTSLFIGYSYFTAKYYAYEVLTNKTDNVSFLWRYCKDLREQEKYDACYNAGRLISKNGIFWVDQKFGQSIQYYAGKDTVLKYDIDKVNKKYMTLLEISTGRTERSLKDLSEAEFELLISDIFLFGELPAFEKTFSKEFQ